MATYFVRSRRQSYNTPGPPTVSDVSTRNVSFQQSNYRYFSAFPPITAATSPFSNTFGTSS
jgi:hypothetical protein